MARTEQHLAPPDVTDRLTSLHWRVWFLSAMGVFTDGFDLFKVAGACLLGWIVIWVFGFEMRGLPSDGTAPPAAA